MKRYVAMCSLCLLAGAALGHMNGQVSQAITFVEDCATTRLVVVEDRASDQRRHFHCFEIDISKAHEKPAAKHADLLPVI